MKAWPLYLIFFSTTVFTFNLQGQNYANQEILEDIYDALQDKGKTSHEVAALIPQINLKEIQIPEEVNARHTITFAAIINNHWRSIMFRDLKFNYKDENKIEVTGIVNGRQPLECEYISSRFKHYWSLKDGKIVAFTE